MDDHLSPHEPEHLEPDQLDELLSAELDGELHAAARELGASLDEITARVNATPGADARRAALAAARALLAEPPEIDELLAQRLRAKAIRAASEQHAVADLDRRRRRRQMFLGAGGIAAAAVAIVAVVGGLGHNGGSNTASEKRSGIAALPDENAGSGAKAPVAPVGALGAFSDKRSLATAALSHTPAASGQSTSDAAGTQYANRAFSSAAAPSAQLIQPATTAAPNASADSGRDSAATQKSAAAAGAGIGRECPTPSGITTDDTLVLRATATLSGKPVIVFVFSGHGERAVEIEDSHCTLLDIEMQR